MEQGKNRFNTEGALTTSDLHNQASYEGQAVGVNASVGNDAGKFGVKGAGFGVGQDSGSAQGTTTAGISGIAGDQSVRTGDATGIERIFDQNKVQRDIDAQVAITAEFGKQASKAVGDYAQTQTEEARRLREQARAESDPQRRSELETQAKKLEDAWGDNGSLRLAAHTVIGGLTGGVGGAAGAAVGTLTAPAVAHALSDAGITGPLADVLTAAASTAAGAVAGGVSGAAAAGNEVANNYLKHAEALRLGQLKEQRMIGKCNSACEAEIQELQALDKLRTNQVEGCQGQSTPVCQTVFTDVRKAAAEFVRVNAQGVGVLYTYSDERSETLALAKSTLDGYTVWSTAKGAIESTVDGIKALGKALYAGFQATMGDPQAQAQVKQAPGAIWEFVSDPQNWPQLAGALSPAQREQLAQAYERGDGAAVAAMLGEQISNLPTGGGAGTIKQIGRVSGKAEEIAALAKRADVDRVVEVPAGAKGNWDPSINTGVAGTFQPRTAYVLDNGHTYITDGAGRVNSVEGTLSLNKMDRNAYQQVCAGKSGCIGDDGGHLIASSLGGAGDRLNIVPQASTLNRGEWKRMENFLRGELLAGKAIDVKIDLGYLHGSDGRPSQFIVMAKVNNDIKEFRFDQ